MEEANELLVQILETSKEQLRWQRAAETPRIKATLELALGTEKHRRAYELYDGKSSNIEIAKKVGVSHQALSLWTKKWRDLGIAFENDQRRVQHLVSLAALGISIEADQTKRS